MGFEDRFIKTALRLLNKYGAVRQFQRLGGNPLDFDYTPTLQDLAKVKCIVEDFSEFSRAFTALAGDDHILAGDKRVICPIVDTSNNPFIPIEGDYIQLEREYRIVNVHTVQPADKAIIHILTARV